MNNQKLAPDATDEIGKTYLTLWGALDRESKRWFTLAERVVIVGAFRYATTLAEKDSLAADSLGIASTALELMLSLWLSTRASFEIWTVARFLFKRAQARNEWVGIGIKAFVILCALVSWCGMFWIISHALTTVVNSISKHGAD